MKNFKQFLAEYPKEDLSEMEGVPCITDKELEKFAKEVIGAFQEFLVRRRMDYCEVCSRELTDIEKETIEPYHYNRTCTVHRDFADVYQIDVELQRRKLPSRDFKFNDFFA